MAEAVSLFGDGVGPRFGVWIKLATTESIEIVAAAGYDFVVIDLEHSTIDLDLAARMIVLAKAYGVAPLVRVSDHRGPQLPRMLDAGAAGILLPRIDTVEQAREAVQVMRFPPLGQRGAGGTSRAGRWGLLPRAEYVRVGNEDVLCLPQLESEPAIDAADDILAVPGVNGVFLGAGDLSLSLGLPMKADRVGELLQRGRAAAADAGKPCGAASVDAASTQRAVRAGHQFVVVGNDSSMLAKTAHGLLGGIRELLEQDS